MSQCQRCRKYVHSGCDPEADRSLVQRKKDMNPDYDYLCPPCKMSSPSPNRVSFDNESSVDSKNFLGSGNDLTPQQQQAISSVMNDINDSNSATMNYTEDSNSCGPILPPSSSSTTEAETKSAAVARAAQKIVASQQQTSAGKIARKRMSGSASASVGAGGRPKGSGKASSFGVAVGGAAYNRKANKLADFGRKRGPKPKMRGVFGSPGGGLQRPGGGAEGSATGSSAGGNASSSVTSSGTIEGEPCLENKLILCSSTDGFVVEQDACAMCGSFGLDQEGRLISCAQCGQVKEKLGFNDVVILSM